MKATTSSIGGAGAVGTGDGGGCSHQVPL